MIEKFYDDIGGSYHDVSLRLPSDALIEKFVKKFAADDSYPKLVEAINQHDIAGSFSAAHTLKGVAGNLAFTALESATSALTEQLRPKTDEADPILFANVAAEYDRVIAAITEYMEE